MTEATPHPRKPICLIAAMDETRAIGRGNDIPWRIPGEQKHFRELTMGNALIMGRLTYDSIGRPLPGRKIIILSRSNALAVAGAEVAHSVEEALRLAHDFDGRAICIGGGEEIYRMFMPLADVLYLTQIHASYGGDRFFPEFSEQDFALTASERVEGAVPYTRLTYERRR
jgi:dihydrofolate reductase